jgi:hypothetical protein
MAVNSNNEKERGIDPEATAEDLEEQARLEAEAAVKEARAIADAKSQKSKGKAGAARAAREVRIKMNAAAVAVFFLCVVCHHSLSHVLSL